MKLRLSKTSSIGVVSLFLLFTLLFQNCSPVRYKEVIPQTKASGGNGGPYAGMQKMYHHYDSVQPCRLRDRNDKPLANTSILFKNNSEGILAPFLARENCSDLQDPTLVADQDIQINDGTSETFAFKNVTMAAYHPNTDFDIVAASCPTGLSPIPGVQRTNLFSHSLDWTRMMSPTAIGPDRRYQPNAVLGWYMYDGIGVQLASSFQGLPAFMVSRPLSTNLENWSRQSQYVQLKSNVDYLFSFVAQSGSVNGVDFHLYRPMDQNPGPLDESVMVTFNLQSGTANVEYAQNTAQVRADVIPFGNAYLCTVSFRSSATAGDQVTNLGITPTAFGRTMGQTGDYFIGSAAQLVEVKSFCQ